MNQRDFVREKVGVSTWMVLWRFLSQAFSGFLVLILFICFALLLYLRSHDPSGMWWWWWVVQCWHEPGQHCRVSVWERASGHHPPLLDLESTTVYHVHVKPPDGGGLDSRPFLRVNEHM